MANCASRIWYLVSYLFVLAILTPTAIAAKPTTRRFTSFDHCRPENVTAYNRQHHTTFSTSSLTFDQCKKVCGTGYAAYSELGVLDAITTWVVPLFVLV